ncbi:(Fe-S)-binding protein [Effusibacillus dendaii]|uniref:Glycolate oxidase iron-sulfur subunit n=1 Tax=Effusibacillus dendaii TaxID=2743772 RepID=A0A7I8DC11_9BACL|nr:(Fe-S)-binding protein [Effusibacillus dendaii]BCJ87713.1 putative glycolate oxidase iron-sulfur subunit [Effusibacillus dendaii]
MNELQKMLEYDETFNCVQCGYCLPACPTYKVLEKESASPRGRIALVKAAAEGKIDVTEHLASPIDLCLGCRACETACPTGVRYGTILEGAKRTLESKRSHKPLVSSLRRFAFRGLFPYPGRLKVIGGLFWFYHKSGLRKAAGALGITDKLPYHLGEFEAALPDVVSPFAYLGKRRTVYAHGGKPKAKVAFFSGCVMDSLFYETNRKTVELLAAAGCDVTIPHMQTCCGALHAHAGELDQAKELAKKNIAAFEASGADWYINNAGGCGAMLVEYEKLLADDPEWAERARNFVRKSRDINTVLADLAPLPFCKPIHKRITYQDSCHLRNVQKVSSEPRQLLQAIPGIDYVELPGADSCCGSAGIYSLLQYDTSMKVLDQKMESVKKTDAVLIVTSNPGCLLQMRMGIQRENLQGRMDAAHIVDLLHEACGL